MVPKYSAHLRNRFRRVSCFFLWNTTEGGPCLLRPTDYSAFDAPACGVVQNPMCAPLAKAGGKIKEKKCENAFLDENNVLHGASADPCMVKISGPMLSKPEELSKEEWKSRNNGGWNNQFGFPWEIGMYWKFHVGGIVFILSGLTDAQLHTVL